MNTEIEKETKFLLCPARKEPFFSNVAEALILKDSEDIEWADHLIIYYDDADDSFLKAGHTARLTLRRKNGEDKHRVTFKANESNTSTVRTCTEYHFLPSQFNQSFPLKNGLFHQYPIWKSLYPSFKDLSLFLRRKAWIRVRRFSLKVEGVVCNLDICKTNKGIYFEELETEEPVTSEWISDLDHIYGITWLSNVSKYKRTRLVNEM